MNLTEDAEINRIIEDSYKPGVDIVEASVPIDNPEYFNEADNYLFTTRSRWARYFNEAGIVPRGAEYNPLDHAMRNDLQDPMVEVEDDEIRAALFIRDLYEANNLNQQSSFQLEVGDKLGRFGAYNREEIGVNPEDFPKDYSGEKRALQKEIPDELSFHYDQIIDPALQPQVETESERQGIDIARNIGVVQLADQLLEPNHKLAKEEIQEAELPELVQKVGERPEKVGTGNYLAVTEEPVTMDGFYTMLHNPMTGAHHLNSRIGDPEWQNPMVVEFSYDQIKGDPGVPKNQVFDFPFRLQTKFIKKT